MKKSLSVYLLLSVIIFGCKKEDKPDPVAEQKITEGHVKAIDMNPLPHFIGPKDATLTLESGGKTAKYRFIVDNNESKNGITSIQNADVLGNQGTVLDDPMISAFVMTNGVNNTFKLIRDDGLTVTGTIDNKTEFSVITEPQTVTDLKNDPARGREIFKTIFNGYKDASPGIAGDQPATVEISDAE